MSSPVSTQPVPQPSGELARFMETAGDLVLYLDPTGVIAYASARTAQSNPALFAGVQLAPLVAIGDAAAYARAFADVAAGGGQQRVDVQLAGQQETWYELQLSALDGNAGVLAIGRDTTHRHQTEQ
ncbi:MAG TPA: PAS domain-containing protein, partial [Burkholderiaceae bacterium]